MEQLQAGIKRWQTRRAQMFFNHYDLDKRVPLESFVDASAIRRKEAEWKKRDEERQKEDLCLDTKIGSWKRWIK